MRRRFKSTKKTTTQQQNNMMLRSSLLLCYISHVIYFIINNNKGILTIFIFFISGVVLLFQIILFVVVGMCKKEIDLVGCIPSVQHPIYNYISRRNIIIYAGTHNFRRIHSGSIMILHTLHTTLFELHAQNQKSVWRLPWTQYGIRILSIHLEVRLKVAGL